MWGCLQVRGGFLPALRGWAPVTEGVWNWDGSSTLHACTRVLVTVRLPSPFKADFPARNELYRDAGWLEIMTFHCRAPPLPFLFSYQNCFTSYFVTLHGSGWETTGNSDPETYLWLLRLICKVTDTLTLSSAGVWMTSAPFYLARNPFGLAGWDHAGQAGWSLFL